VRGKKDSFAKRERRAFTAERPDISWARKDPVLGRTHIEETEAHVVVGLLVDKFLSAESQIKLH
jgi:hypothetical protein